MELFKTESLRQQVEGLVHFNCLLQGIMLHSERQANVYKDEVITLNVENTSLRADVQEMELTRKEIREVIYDISFKVGNPNFVNLRVKFANLCTLL